MLQVKRSLHSHPRALPLVASGSLLIAATYGMARFGVGLLHPALTTERPGIATALPSAGAAQFVSYCLAAGVAAPLVPRWSRAVAGLAGVVAGVGCLGIATSTTADGFVASAFVGGAGAGLASPALVGLLDRAVPDVLSSSSQAVVNAGTSVGVIGTGVLATTFAAPVVAWYVMAVLCLVSAMAVVTLSRGARSTDPAPPRGDNRLPALTWPILSALGAGAISSAAWTYGPTVVVAGEALPADRIGLLWVALGLGGLAGALVHRPVARWGPGRAFLVCAALLVAGSILVLAPILAGAWCPLLGAAVFGAAYMSLSGVLILWGRLLDAERGAAITAWLFIALAVGQAGGAKLLGSLFT
jgi:predicted MFS family arabinose efflux permease